MTRAPGSERAAAQKREPTPPRLFNTLGRHLEELEPLEPGKVRLYSCGPTVYNHVHIGNLRAFLVGDLLRRSLRFLGYQVYQAMNLTDVDDKTIEGARLAEVSLDEFTAPFIESFFQDLDTLRMERAETYPRATRHLPEILALIEELVARGHAYVKEGTVFFRIASDPDYGKLSGADLTQVQSGERVAHDEYGKDDVRDFALWKAAKPGEPFWDSPWGPGRPGWHIECSAMSMKYLGETFDIHSGGVDLVFPHHENEIAQSESATGRPFARLWLHSEHLIVDGQKMAKSLGNFFTLKDLLELGADPRAVRYLLLSVHYRQKLNFTFEALKGAAGALERVDEMRFRLDNATEGVAERPDLAAAARRLEQEVGEALADDLNSSAALAALFRFVKEVNVAVEEGRIGQGDRRRVASALAKVDQVFGFLDAEEWKGSAAAPAVTDEEVERLVQEREEARRARDFQRADGLRDELSALGVAVEDTPGGPRWKRVAAS